MEKLQEKHLRSNNSGGYLDKTQVNQAQSYYIESKPRAHGGRYVYQYVTMNDGTVYELSSNTASTNGIIPHTCIGKPLLQRDIKRMTSNAIDY